MSDWDWFVAFGLGALITNLKWAWLYRQHLRNDCLKPQESAGKSQVAP